GDRKDKHPADVVATVDRIALLAHALQLLSPYLEARWGLPAQQPKALLDLAPRSGAIGGNQTPRCTDERGESAANVDVQPERNFGMRQREHDHVIEPDNFHADRGDVPLPRET